MKYTQPSFTIPVGGSKLTDLEYDLRVGKITQEQYDAITKYESATIKCPSFCTCGRHS